MNAGSPDIRPSEGEVRGAWKCLMEGSSSSDRYTERCALATELAQVLDTVRQLEAQMGAKGIADDGGERCRALVSSMRSSVDRSIHIAMSLCCAPGAPGPGSPPSAEGSPRSGGSDQGADSRCRGANAAGQCKKRKALPKWSTQVRVNTVQDVGPLDDGFSWRKYGQKDILGAKYPRAYFRCTYRHTQSCHASKQVQRADGDPLLFDVVYHGNHTCAQCNSLQRPRHAASGEQWQPQPAGAGGQEVSSIIPVGLKDEGLVKGLLETPFSFQSKPACAADTGGGGAPNSDFPAGCTLTASPFVSPAVVRNVPDVEVELTSTTDSQMADMEFMLQLADADFLDNSRYF
ncbi:hypothetical protein QYE76_054302 [Lolium multiflorum]|uniref:WRKY domain-containing protein n=1 Tax=Lolium multiflorum TaxID=4521 RepID=A0AAD8WMT1_LOLMU|nr:hypothetical protein QYE76_054302 [Lolium multiflorum]